MGGGGGGFDSKRAGAKGLAFGRGAVFVAVLRGGAKPLLPPFVDVGSWNLAILLLDSLRCLLPLRVACCVRGRCALVPQERRAGRSDARKVDVALRCDVGHCCTGAVLV